jgi:hypothetical protein
MDQMATLLVPMHAYALILMHAYPSAYAYQFDYVCLWLLMRFMYAYICLFTCLWFMISVKEKSIGTMQYGGKGSS